MANFDDLLPDVQVEIPEVPAFAARRALIRAAREFCQETRAWRVSFDLSTVATQALYVLSSDTPSDTELVDIISVKNSAGGEPLVPRTFRWLDKNVTDWRSETAADATWYVMELLDTVRFVYTPSETETDKYHMRVSVKPLLTALTLDDRLVGKYSEALIHGGLARLYRIPRKPWSDGDLATYHEAMFRAEFASARTEAAEEFQTGVPRSTKYGGL